MNFEEQLAADVREIEEILKRYLPKEEGYAKTVAEAVNPLSSVVTVMTAVPL